MPCHSDHQLLSLSQATDLFAAFWQDGFPYYRLAPLRALALARLENQSQEVVGVISTPEGGFAVAGEIDGFLGHFDSSAVDRLRAQWTKIGQTRQEAMSSQ
jgi:hypothetical protein